MKIYRGRALLLFMVVQPVLGIVMIWSEGDPLIVPLTSWLIAPLLAVGEGWEETLDGLHETVGNVFYGVIGLHVRGTRASLPPSRRCPPADVVTH